jgi:hypothetical protein
MRDRDPDVMIDRSADTSETKILYRISVNLSDALIEGDDIVATA